jgi:hypothetical protein
MFLAVPSPRGDLEFFGFIEKYNLQKFPCGKTMNVFKRYNPVSKDELKALVGINR